MKKRLVPVMAALCCIGAINANATDYPGTPKTTDTGPGKVQTTCSPSASVCVRVISFPYLGSTINLYHPMDLAEERWFMFISQTLSTAPHTELGKYFQAGVDGKEFSETVVEPE